MAINSNPESTRSQNGKEDTVTVAVQCEEKIAAPKSEEPWAGKVCGATISPAELE
jgi:hypothetical protein